eukprot:134856-Chlamydomonas_euryale.AAC.4
MEQFSLHLLPEFERVARSGPRAAGYEFERVARSGPRAAGCEVQGRVGDCRAVAWRVWNRRCNMPCAARTQPTCLSTVRQGP